MDNPSEDKKISPQSCMQVPSTFDVINFFAYEKSVGDIFNGNILQKTSPEIQIEAKKKQKHKKHNTNNKKKKKNKHVVWKRRTFEEAALL